MFKLLYTLVFCSFVTLFSTAVNAQNESPLVFCVESTEFPPFNYFVRDGKHKTETLAGYDIEVLKHVFEDIPYEVIALPWRRCLMSLTTGAVDAAMSASMNDQRRKDYISSAPYYYLTPGYFFLKQNKDAPREVAAAEDLWQYGALCGLGGHNYANFGLAADKDVMRMASYEQLAETLKMGRCRFYLDRLELVAPNMALMDNPPLPPLEKGLINGAAAEPFYVLISRKSPNSESLKRLFDERIAVLRASGKLAQILEQATKKLEPATR